jgi:NDP-sugar pyrophosphorylase family protein
MVPVKGKPFLEYQLDLLRLQGLTDVVLCVGYRANVVRAYFGNGKQWGMHISYAVEAAPLGTAGALRNALQYTTEPFLVLNGDSYTQVDLSSLERAHKRFCDSDSDAVGTLLVTPAPTTEPFGSVEVDSGGRVRSFTEKRAGTVGPVSSGIYILNPEALQFIPGGRPVSIEYETFPILLSVKHLYAYFESASFIDVGTPEGYARFVASASSSQHHPG